LSCVVKRSLAGNPKLILLKYEAGGDTNFTSALKRTQAIMTSHWSNERTPVVIFLSDGWCDIGDEDIYNICYAASSRGKPLSFHAIASGQSFLPSTFSYVIRQIPRHSSLIAMVNIAREVQKTVPQGMLTANIPSSFTKALDPVRNQIDCSLQECNVDLNRSA
ncbi:hypothetical protein EDB87DRAFT_1562862, partial [Lactarius vividus]